MNVLQVIFPQLLPCSNYYLYLFASIELLVDEETPDSSPVRAVFDRRKYGVIVGIYRWYSAYRVQYDWDEEDERKLQEKNKRIEQRAQNRENRLTEVGGRCFFNTILNERNNLN